jgi:hypothetical protein
MRFDEFINEDKINGITVIPLDSFVKNGYPKNIEDMEDDEVLDEADFGLGSQYRTAGDEEMYDYLGRVKQKDTSKLDPYKMPYIHGSNIKIKDESGKSYDLEALKKAITTRPTSLLKQNEKMKHSDGSASIFFNVGLPALKGLAVNEETGEFVIVDTCPGAGICKTYCYAKKGSYVMFKAVSMKQTQTLNFLLNDPSGFTAKLSEEIKNAVEKYQTDNVQVIVRWHDSGDFFSPEYLKVAYAIARSFPTVKFYAYTKIADVAKGSKPDNFEMNFSGGALPSQEKQVNLVQIKHSKVVPRADFYDLVAKQNGKLVKDARGRMQFRNPEALAEFKDRLASKYKINRDTILTYDEMMDIPEGNTMKWNVIVMPGCGDQAAARKDVLGSYLLFH